MDDINEIKEIIKTDNFTQSLTILIKGYSDIQAAFKECNNEGMYLSIIMDNLKKCGQCWEEYTKDAKIDEIIARSKFCYCEKKEHCDSTLCFLSKEKDIYY